MSGLHVCPSQEAGSGWDRIRVLDRVIPLDTARAGTGLRFEDGTLFMEAGGMALSLGVWPNPCARLRRRDGGWLPTERLADDVLGVWEGLEPGEAPTRDPFAVLEGKRGSRDKTEAALLSGGLWPFSLYFERIPFMERSIVARYRHRRFHILGFLASDERCRDLAETNPGLAFALASSWRFRSGNCAAGSAVPRAAPGWKRRELAGWLGFPNTETSVRALRIIAPRALDLSTLLRLRARMREEDVCTTLSRLSRIDAATLRILAEPRLSALVSMRLFHDLEAAACEDCGYCGRSCPVAALERVRGIARALGRRRLGPIASLAGLEELVAGLAGEYERRSWQRLARVSRRRFGTPPFAGTEGIEPITTEAGLYAEGLEMGNCVPDYLAEVHAGGAYFYKVTDPSRATLLLRRLLEYGAWSWVPCEIRGPANTSFPEADEETVLARLMGSAVSEASRLPEAPGPHGPHG